MSTVKVDTIQTTGGVSEIAIDKLKGVSAASSISVVAEGGTTTTNLQQGVAKAWTNVSADGATVNDSFNNTSITDTGTGIQTVNHANDFSNANYSCHLTIGGDVSKVWINNQAAGSFDGRVYTGSAYSDQIQRHTSHGDLA